MRQKSEMMCQRHQHGIVGESGVTVGAVQAIASADRAVALQRPRTVNRQRVPPVAVHQSGFKRDHVPGTAEPVTSTKSIANRNAFDTSTKTERQVPNSGDQMRDSTAEEVLVVHGHDVFVWLA